MCSHLTLIDILVDYLPPGMPKCPERDDHSWKFFVLQRLKHKNNHCLTDCSVVRLMCSTIPGSNKAQTQRDIVDSVINAIGNNEE
jgi:hypothetical protein